MNKFLHCLCIETCGMITDKHNYVHDYGVSQEQAKVKLQEAQKRLEPDKTTVDLLQPHHGSSGMNPQ